MSFLSLHNNLYFIAFCLVLFIPSLYVGKLVLLVGASGRENIEWIQLITVLRDIFCLVISKSSKALSCYLNIRPFCSYEFFVYLLPLTFHVIDGCIRVCVLSLFETNSLVSILFILSFCQMAYPCTHRQQYKEQQ